MSDEPHTTLLIRTGANTNVAAYAVGTTEAAHYFVAFYVRTHVLRLIIIALYISCFTCSAFIIFSLSFGRISPRRVVEAERV